MCSAHSGERHGDDVLKCSAVRGDFRLDPEPDADIDQQASDRLGVPAAAHKRRVGAEECGEERLGVGEVALHTPGDLGVVLGELDGRIDQQAAAHGPVAQRCVNLPRQDLGDSRAGRLHHGGGQIEGAQARFVLAYYQGDTFTFICKWLGD